MKFYPLEENQPQTEAKTLEAEYAEAREIGKIRLGEQNLYFRTGRKIYYIPYPQVRRCFRRVMLVPAKLCCGKGDLEVENLVICGDSGELAQVQLPGTRAAKILMEELENRIPEAEFGTPSHN